MLHSLQAISKTAYTIPISPNLPFPKPGEKIKVRLVERDTMTGETKFVVEDAAVETDKVNEENV